MKTKEDYKLFLNDLKRLCDKHRIDIDAICSAEGIGGEVVLLDRDEDLDYCATFKYELKDMDKEGNSRYCFYNSY